MPAPPPQLSTSSLFGIPFVVSDLGGACRVWTEQASRTKDPVLIAHSDAHVLGRMLHEEEYGREVARNFSYICPDGMPLVWLLRRRKKQTSAHRLYGPDVMEEMWNQGRSAHIRHFLLGGTEEAVARLTENLGKRFPGAFVAGSMCPPMGRWSKAVDDEMIRALRDSNANCVWVGLGCPKQEKWLFTHRAELPPALYFGVGAAFNFHAGLVKQAPPWVRAHGLEWLYRLGKEPRRLFKRYAVHIPRFLWYCLTRPI